MRKNDVIGKQGCGYFRLTASFSRRICCHGKLAYRDHVDLPLGIGGHPGVILVRHDLMAGETLFHTRGLRAPSTCSPCFAKDRNKEAK